MRHDQAQVSAAGIVWQRPDGSHVALAPDTPPWYDWLADPGNERLLFVDPSLGRFVLRHERKQRGGWYWSIYCRRNGRLRKAYLGKGDGLSLQRIQAAAHSLATGGVAPSQLAPAVRGAPGTPLLAAKLAPPPLPPRTVVRPRLLAQLAAASEHPLTLLLAPAGAGKTTLLVSWIASSDGAGLQPAAPRFAWLSLDAHDNDPARFLTYLCAACEQQLQPAVGVLPLGLLQAPQPVVSEVVLASLMASLSAANSPVVLVLDDYHLLVNRAIHEALALVIEHLPPNVRLILAGRSEPPLPVARLRARGQLAELGAGDLRFTPIEAHQLLTGSLGLRLTLAQSEALERRSEGWAAGLHLMALLAVQQGVDLDTLLAVGGGQRAIADYLATEVLATQPKRMQDFLLLTSIVDRLCGPLCDALVGEGQTVRGAGEEVRGAGEEAKDQDTPTSVHRPSSIVHRPSSIVLDELERANLFIVPLDAERRWYRYHQLFGDVLRDRLQRGAPDLVPELHRRAALWYAKEGLMVEAVGHGLAVDAALAADLVESCGRTLLMRGAVTTALGWVERLPDGLVADRPNLGLIAAWALAAAGRLDSAALRLDNVEAALGRHDDERELTGEVLAVRAAIAGLRRDLPTTLALCQAALARLSPRQGYVRSVVLQLLGGAAYASGDPNGASRPLDEALRLGQASGNLYIIAFATRHLADVRVAQGRLAEAERLYRQVPGVAEGGPALRALPIAGMAAVGLGELFYRRNDLDGAAQLIVVGLAAGEQGQDVEIVVRGCLALARVRLAQGDEGAARSLLTRAAVASIEGTAWLQAWVAAETARYAVLAGDIVQASAWAHNSGLSLEDAPSFLYETNYFTLVRVVIAAGGAGELEEARSLLARLRADAERSGRIFSQIEAAILEAQLLHRTGEHEAAGAALLWALELGSPADYARTYLDGGPVVGALLRRLLRGGALPSELRATVGTLANSFARPAVHQLPHGLELLSPRELEVLALLAAGRTNQQIAHALIISLATVKKHLANLYGKLGASSRTEALARARELGVAPER